MSTWLPDSNEKRAQSAIPSTDPQVAVAVRQLRRRHRWNAGAIWCLVLFILLGGGYLSTLGGGSQPAPRWFLGIVIVIGVCGSVMGVLAARCSKRLQALPADARSQARELAGPRWSFRMAHQTMLWLGMLLFVWFASVCVPAVINGAAYLAGVGPSGIFTGTSYGSSCDSDGNCNQVTIGVLHQGASATSYTWPATVPLGHPVALRLPVIQWAFTFPVHNDADAIGSLVIGLLGLFAFALVVRFGYRKLRAHSANARV